MGILVQHGLQSLKGLEDDEGPVEVVCVNGKLAEDDVEMLHDNGLVLDLWRAVKHYNELSAKEKKQFGGRQQLT